MCVLLSIAGVVHRSCVSDVLAATCALFALASAPCVPYTRLPQVHRIKVHGFSDREVRGHSERTNIVLGALMATGLSFNISTRRCTVLLCRYFVLKYHTSVLAFSQRCSHDSAMILGWISEEIDWTSSLLEFPR